MNTKSLKELALLQMEVRRLIKADKKLEESRESNQWFTSLNSLSQFINVKNCGMLPIELIAKMYVETAKSFSTLKSNKLL
jgi:hypothetical protein